MKTPFLGGHTVSRSTNLADNQCINLYAELLETKDGKEIGAFYQTPGLTLFLQCGPGPIRAMYPTPAFLWVVSGNQVYTINNAFGIGNPGSLRTSTGPVSMISTGQNIGYGDQLAIFDGQFGYGVSNSGILAPITLPFTQAPTFAAYQDGFGLLVEAKSQTIWQSNSFDLLTWPALNFQAATVKPDLVIAIASVQDQLWIFKQYTTEVWGDVGGYPFAFQLIPGAFSEFGCAAAYSVAVTGGTVIWLAQNQSGTGEVRIASGYQSKKISTHAMQEIWSGYPTVSDAQAYTVQQQGHDWYVLTFPSASATWAYDLSTGLWAQWAEFYQGEFIRHQSNCACIWREQNLVGDFQSGNIYQLTPGGRYDNGQQRKWLRTWRALAKPTMQPVRFAKLTMDMQTGTSTPVNDVQVIGDGTGNIIGDGKGNEIGEGLQLDASNQISLRWSDDGGHRWSHYVQRDVGDLGETAKRVMFKRLGSTRRATGLDRIFELSSSDAFDVALMGAEIE